MINIAIDGHVGSGKSTLAHGIAKRLNLRVLDTGAIYRGLGYAFKESGIGEFNNENVDKFIENIDVKVDFIDDLQHVFVNGKDYTPFLRLEETSMLASIISKYPNLRKKVLHIQKDFAKKYDCVMEGRDIGTEVLPNALVKIFLTADENIRANRRFLQVKDSNTTLEEVLKDLKQRDYNDSHREVAPLKPAENAIIFDNGDLTLEETIDKCVEIINEKLGN